MKNYTKQITAFAVLSLFAYSANAQVSSVNGDTGPAVVLTSADIIGLDGNTIAFNEATFTTAITGNTAANGLTQADVDANELASDAADLVLTNANAATQADVDANELASDAADLVLTNANAATQADVDANELASDAADLVLTNANAATQADVDANELASDAADLVLTNANAATQADVDQETTTRAELISSTGVNADNNQIVHIGDNSLVTQELGGVQQLHAEDAGGNAIDIVVTNGSDFAVRTADPAATNTNIGINSGLNPQIIDPDLTDSLVPVVTTRDGLGLEKVDFSNSGVTLFQNGDVTLEQSSGNQLNVELGTVTSFDVDANTGVPIPGSQSWIAGYYTDVAGNIVDVSDFAAAVLADPTTAGDYTFNAINDPRFISTVDELTLIANLQGIEPDDAVFNGIAGADGELLVETTVLAGQGGNLQVGGDANVDGVLSLGDNGDGAVADVAAAINGNTAANGLTQADVDANELASDAADLVLTNANAATQADVDANELASDAADLVLTNANAATQADVDANELASDAADLVLTNANAATQADVDANELASDAADLVLGSRIDNNAGAIANNSSRIASNKENIEQNTRGIAMVAALQHTTVLPGMTNAFDLSAAHFEGETGLALNFARRLSDNVQINFGAASTTDFDESVIKAGIGVQW